MTQAWDELDRMCEDALSAILKEYDGNSSLAVAGRIGAFPEYMKSAYNEVCKAEERGNAREFLQMN